VTLQGPFWSPCSITNWRPRHLQQVEGCVSSTKWSLRLKLHNLEISLSVEIRREAHETRINSQRREVHMKSASEFHHLENFLSVGLKHKA